MSRPKTAIYEEPVDHDETVMTVEDYLDSVKCGAFIDYDGFGEAVRDGKIARTNHWGANEEGAIEAIRPSEGDAKIPEDATHIVWFNR